MVVNPKILWYTAAGAAGLYLAYKIFGASTALVKTISENLDKIALEYGENRVNETLGPRLEYDRARSAYAYSVGGDPRYPASYPGWPTYNEWLKINYPDFYILDF